MKRRRAGFVKPRNGLAAAREIANAVIVGNGADPHWTATAQTLVAALLLHAQHRKAKHYVKPARRQV